MSFLDNDEVLEPHIHTNRSRDEYMHQPYWKATLSDGTEVFSHPQRRSWLELKSFLEHNPSITIEGLYFGFRDHLETIHVGQADYFFTHSVLCEYGGPTQFFYIGGYRDGDIIRCKKYRIPEVFIVEEESRGLDDLSVIRGLIERKFYENYHTCESTGSSTES